jgi:hypothetical protein
MKNAIRSLLVASALTAGCSSSLPPEQKARRAEARAESKSIVEAGLKAKREDAMAAAAVACRDYVRKRLEVPLTALFAPAPETIKQNLGDGRYQISGYVDSKNASGELVRTRFACDLHTRDGREFIMDDETQEFSSR